MLIGHLNPNIKSECLLSRFKISLISPKCPWKQYRQPENGRKIHDSSALLTTVFLQTRNPPLILDFPFTFWGPDLLFWLEK